MTNDFFALFHQEVFQTALHYAWLLWPVWAPIIAIDIGFREWLRYKQREWINGQGRVLLEVKLPNEQMKSPAAMEVFLSIFNQTGVGTLTDVYLKGRVRSWFSLELVSNGGQVHFYIWMHSKWKKTVETQLYSLFPNVEIHEVQDYALDVHYDKNKYKFSKLTDIVLTKPNAYPIKTYIDYGLHDDPKEEYKNDPLVPLLEYLGSLKKGEYAWIQILIQGHAKETFKYTRLIPKADWKAEVEAEIKKIAKEAKFKTPEDKGSDSKFLSEGQKDMIKAIERTLEKPAFDTMIRAFYFSEIDANDPNKIGGLLSSFKPFSSNTLNGFKPGWGADYDYPWQDFKETRRSRNEKKMLDAYKKRSYFNVPYKHFHDKPYILTTEELATLYHFPSSMVATTPTLTRVPSKKAEAPANIPV